MSAGAVFAVVYLGGAVLSWPIFTTLIARHERSSGLWRDEDWIVSAAGGVIVAMGWPVTIAGFYVIRFAKWALDVDPVEEKR